MARPPAGGGRAGWYLQRHLGDFFAFSHAQIFWHRHTATLGPLGGLWSAASAGVHGGLDVARHLPRGQGFSVAERLHFWNAAHLVLLVPAGWLTWVAWRRVSRAAGLYSLTTLLVVLAAPADGFPLESLPRFLLSDFPLVLALAVVLEARPRAREWTLIAFAAVGAAAAVAFSRGGWVA